MICMLIAANTEAQTVITGHINNTSPMIVYAYPGEGDAKTMIGYASTDDNGNYSISFDNKELKKVKLVVRGMDVETTSKTIDNTSQTVDFQVKQKQHHLKEVVVKAQKIKEKGDTIEYNASSYTNENDRVLKDILKKMPGITVSEDGKISFNGKWIKEFYIEGNDLLGDNYQIASNNVDANSIATVQVLQNHQDAKVREGRLSDTPSLNITLKNKAKGVIAANLDAALGGIPLAREVSGVAMKFTENTQNISFLKSNNTGTSLSKEINMKDHIENVEGVGVLMPEKAPLNDSWSNRNDAHSASINQLFRIDDDNRVTISANYLKNRQKNNASAISNYFLTPDSSLTIRENNAAISHIDELGMNVQYKYNNKFVGYMKNKFHVDVNKARTNGELATDEALQNQHFDNKGMSIINNFEFLFPLTSVCRNIFSTITYDWNSGNLNFEDKLQRIKAHHFTANTSSGIVLKQDGGAQYIAMASYTADYKKVFTENSIAMNDDNAFKNYLSLAPLFRYSTTRKIEFSATFPLGFRLMSLNSNTSHKNHAAFTFEPHLSMKIVTSGKTDLNLQGSLSREYDDLMNMMPMMYYQNYRTINCNKQIFKPALNQQWKAYLDYNYKNVIRMFFSNISLDYTYTKNPRCMAYSSRDGLLYYHLADSSSYIKNISLHQETAKGFYFWNGKMSEIITLGKTWQSYFIGGDMIKTSTRYCMGQLTFNFQPTKWLYLYSENLLSISYPQGNSIYASRNLTFNSRLQLDMTVIPHVVLSCDGQLYHNRYLKQSNDNQLMNLNLNWNLKRVRLYAKCLNVFDNRTYHRVNTTSILQQIDDITLRGRTIQVGIQLKVL